MDNLEVIAAIPVNPPRSISYRGGNVHRVSFFHLTTDRSNDALFTVCDKLMWIRGASPAVVDDSNITCWACRSLIFYDFKENIIKNFKVKELK
jgi:hypothetical protein